MKSDFRSYVKKYRDSNQADVSVDALLEKFPFRLQTFLVHKKCGGIKGKLKEDGKFKCQT